MLGVEAPSEICVCKPAHQILPVIKRLAETELCADKRMFNQHLQVFQAQAAPDFFQKQGNAFGEGGRHRLSRTLQTERESSMSLIVRAKCRLHKRRLPFWVRQQKENVLVPKILHFQSGLQDPVAANFQLPQGAVGGVYCEGCVVLGECEPFYECKRSGASARELEKSQK